MTNVPDAERAAQLCIGLNRANLNQFIDAFSISCRLFELMERGGGPSSVGVLGGDFTKFREIAARDAALNLYHFLCSLRAIKRQLPTCQSLSTVDNQIIREAVRNFNTAFPNTDSIRHAVAHAGELYKTPKHTERNFPQLKMDASGNTGSIVPIPISSIYGREYSVGIEGKLCTIKVEIKSAQILSAIVNQINQAFAIADAGRLPAPEN